MMPRKTAKGIKVKCMDDVDQSWIAQQRREYLRLAKANLEATLELLDASRLPLAANYVSTSIDIIDVELERLSQL